MSDMDITAPEVSTTAQRARFYRSGDRDFIEISFVGNPDTVIRRVEPAHMARFKNEWDAYCDGLPPKMRAGTPLTDLVNEGRAQHYIARNIHNLEELACLDDNQCQGVGHGTMTDRKNARNLIEQRKIEAMQKASRKITNMTSDATKLSATEAPAPNAEITEIKDTVNKLSDTMSALMQTVAAMAAAQQAPARRGRPPKAKEAD
jgi:putative alpha-1,2-mannosidase